MFSSEYCENVKDSFFIEHHRTPLVAVSVSPENYLKNLLPTCSENFTKVVIFAAGNTFFQLSLVYTADSRTGYHSGLLLGNFFLSPGMLFLTNQISGSN